MGPICAIQMKIAMEMDIATTNIVFAYPTTTFYKIAHIMDVRNNDIFMFLIYISIIFIGRKFLKIFEK